jgi:hypothetical protein
MLFLKLERRGKLRMEAFENKDFRKKNGKEGRK